MANDEETNPLEEALHNYTSMRSENILLKQTVTNHEKQLMEQSHQITFLEGERTRLQRERDLYQRYSVQISTRLKTIYEQIEAAEKEASLSAVQLDLSSQAAPQPSRPPSEGETPENVFEQGVVIKGKQG